nr:DNA polymerase III subunit delta' [Maliibacterium massiliense]
MQRMGLHATIVSGDIAAGRVVALQQAAAMFCRAAQPPCGRCSVCNRVYQLQHPDVHVVAPAKGTSIGVEQVRALAREVFVRPFEAQMKVFIIEQADAMTTQAQNALLKTLEEPPADTAFFLLSDNMDLLLPTIRSRCGLMQAPRLSLAQLQAHLEGKGVARPRAHQAAMWAQGSLRRAQSLAEDDAFFALGSEACGAMCTALMGSAADMCALTDMLQGQRERALQVLAWWQCLLHDLLVLSSGAQAPCYYDPPTREMRACARRYQKGVLHLLDAVALAQQQLRGNVNVSLAVDGLLLAVSKEKNRWPK